MELKVNGSLEVILGGAPGTQLPWSASWVEVAADASSSAPDTAYGATNGVTAVTLVPAATAKRTVRHVNIYNIDTAAAAVTVRVNDNTTMRIQHVVTLPVGAVLYWSLATGWQVISSSGQVASGIIGGYAQVRTTQILTASSGTYTTPAGVRALYFEVIGAGGGGGGASGTTASNAAVGGGGAAGAWACKFVVSPAATYAYTIGAAGTAGANSGGTGGTGGDAVIAGVTAKGGLGGVGMVFGTAVLAALGGAGVIATSGDINSRGGPGQNAIRLSGTVAISGAGGSGMYGGGGAGLAAAGAGLAAAGYGAGGGGACDMGVAAQIGGVGTIGFILVTEYY